MLRKTKTLSSILSTFGTVASDLRLFVERKKDETAGFDDAREALAVKIEANETDISKAEAVLANIVALTGGVHV